MSAFRSGNPPPGAVIRGTAGADERCRSAYFDCRAGQTSGVIRAKAEPHGASIEGGMTACY